LQKRELQAIEDSGGTAIIYTEPSMTKQNLRELITSGKGTGKD
jgi:hypothetical protein